MPTTIGSLLVFVASLTPGFVYLMRTETRLPGRRYTPVRETALIVSASLAAYGVVLSIFWVVRVALPTRTPEVGLLILDPTRRLLPGSLRRGHTVGYIDHLPPGRHALTRPRSADGPPGLVTSITITAILRASSGGQLLFEDSAQVVRGSWPTAVRWAGGLVRSEPEDQVDAVPGCCRIGGVVIDELAA